MMESIQETLQSWKNRWQSLSRPKKILGALSAILIVDLLVAIFVIMFYDETHVFTHLFIASLLFSLFYVIFCRSITFVNKRLYPKTDSKDPIPSLTYLYSLIVFSLISFLPFSGIPMVPVNLFAIFSAIPLIARPFKMMLPGTYTGFLIAGTVTLMAMKGLHWLLSSLILVIAIPLFLYQIWPNRTHELMLSEEEVEKRNTSKTRRALLSVGSLVLFTVSMVVVSFLVILSMNYFWVSAEEVSKYETLHRFPPHVSLHVARVSTVADLAPYKSLSGPVVIKPNVCTTSSRNVKVCRNYQCLVSYLTKLRSQKPLDQADKLSWVIQDFCQKQEGVVFYYRYPYCSKGTIKNIGIRNDAMSDDSSLSAQYFPREYREASLAMTAFFDDLANRIPGYTGGRFDIMMDSWESAQQGQGIYLLETNVFPLDSIDEKFFDTTEFYMAIQRSFRQFRTQLMQIWFGIYNILAGYQRSIFYVAFKFRKLVERYELCDHNFEHILAKP